MRGVAQVVREELRGGGSAGAFPAWCEHSLCAGMRSGTGNTEGEQPEGGRTWIGLEKQKYGMREQGLSAGIAEAPVLDSCREPSRKLCLSNTLQHGLKSQKVQQALLCASYKKIILSLTVTCSCMRAVKERAPQVSRLTSLCAGHKHHVGPNLTALPHHSVISKGISVNVAH